MIRRVYVRPTLLDGKPRLVHDRFQRVIKWVEGGVVKTLDVHLSRAIKRGDLEVVEQAEPKKSGDQKGRS
jgi:hypothetical protein